MSKHYTLTPLGFCGQHIVVANKLGTFPTGIQVSHGVCYHGLGLNCTTDLSWFKHITPCGVEDKDVTSLTEMCSRTVPTRKVEPVLAQELADVIGFTLTSNIC